MRSYVRRPAGRFEAIPDNIPPGDVHTQVPHHSLISWPSTLNKKLNGNYKALAHFLQYKYQVRYIEVNNLGPFLAAVLMWSLVDFFSVFLRGQECAASPLLFICWFFIHVWKIPPIELPSWSKHPRWESCSRRLEISVQKPDLERSEAEGQTDRHIKTM